MERCDPAPRFVPLEELTLKADPAAQRHLLDLQEVDTTLDQLKRRLKNLPEVAALAELNERRTDLEQRRGHAKTEADDVGLEQRKADSDVEQVKSRRVRDLERVDKGLVASPRELEALQSEIVSLDRRIASLEDTELDVMERLEQAQNELRDIESDLADTERRIAEQEVARDRAVADLAEQRVGAETERGLIAAAIPDDLLGLYQRIRAQFDGVGVGVLRQGRCEACRLELTAADLSAIRAAPDDEVLRCEECQRILVRTAGADVG